ncbi:pseudouridine synthase mitochondrial precursor [Volvox carteri f. nagariensis]|uniref:Pseudouridine synthase mitochondrial n=1 Tax=Volvox carteri f. nagariensis TaxID=3068 RepID=D8U5Z2_VOLCA|nr:pseudouridine synthase mitochondrial precursor [Volvox carteri f. nagariensis]EFJ44768.1 pseudouridine synthase mitochondrial precursor [Volvox carteri f. nagariensis]|eukprot:XP_002954051.1 pseudouridine synthase mitochondrial precursor [Volvox carteri f. nagariensis]
MYLDTAKVQQKPQMALAEARHGSVLWMAIGPQAMVFGSSVLREVPNLSLQVRAVDTVDDSEVALESLLRLVRQQTYTMVVLDHVEGLAPPPRPLPHPAARGMARLPPAPPTVAVQGGAATAGRIDASMAAREPAVVAAPVARGPGAAALTMTAAKGQQHQQLQVYQRDSLCASSTGYGSSTNAAWHYQYHHHRSPQPLDAVSSPLNLKAFGLPAHVFYPKTQFLQFLHNVLPLLIERTLADLSASCGPDLRTTTLVINSYPFTHPYLWRERIDRVASVSSSLANAAGVGARSRWARRAILRYAAATLHVTPEGGEAAAAAPGAATGSAAGAGAVAGAASGQGAPVRVLRAVLSRGGLTGEEDGPLRTWSLTTPVRSALPSPPRRLGEVEQWLQLFAASQGASSVWVGAGARLDSWRGLSAQQSIGAPSSKRSTEAINHVTPGQALESVVTLALHDSQQKALRARALLERFMESFDTTPPASYIRSVGVPTAMSWMRRRGPDVPHAVLYRLFRQRQWLTPCKQHHPRQTLRNQVQYQHQSQIQNQNQQQQQQLASRRDAAARAAAAIAAAAAARRADIEDASGGGGEDRYSDEGDRLGSHSYAGPGPGSSNGSNGKSITRGRSAPPTPTRLLQHPLALSPERVRRWVLAVHPGLLFLNKPAGVRVHGMAAGDEAGRGAGRSGDRSGVGGGMRPPAPVTLNDVMQEGLRFGQWDEPRLVHRLDQAASGVMALSRERRGGEDRDPNDEDEEAGGFGGRGGDPARRGRVGPGGLALNRDERVGRDGEMPAIHRTYWAFLAGDLQPRQSGRVSLPVVVDGVLCPAVTAYRVKATGCGVSWVELTPETGRRHQLRIHCARKLGAPIIGDGRYGYRGLPPRLALRDHLPPEWWALLGDDPRVVRRSREAAGEPDPLPAPVLLHSRELVVKRPGKAALGAVAPLPLYIRQLIEAACWPLPSVG